METVLASAIFARAELLLLRLLPWIELKSSRLREGIGRVGKNNWELRLYFYFVFI
jgi:hypothetical protein